MSRCKPGDLAVVVDAQIKSNLGRIVRVVALHDGTGPLGAIGPKPVWLVSAPTAMNWRDGPKRFRLKAGPVPDACLQPIRGVSEGAKRSVNKSRGNSSTKLAVTPSREMPAKTP
jgi:hypothetical protein